MKTYGGYVRIKPFTLGENGQKNGCCARPLTPIPAKLRSNCWLQIGPVTGLKGAAMNKCRKLAAVAVMTPFRLRGDPHACWCVVGGGIGQGAQRSCCVFGRAVGFVCRACDIACGFGVGGLLVFFTQVYSPHGKFIRIHPAYAARGFFPPIFHQR